MLINGFEKLPQKGWELTAADDLGELAGECERCGTAIRYEHYCSHPQVSREVVVGCCCCGQLIGSPEIALSWQEELKREAPRWHKSDKGNWTARYLGIRMTVFSSRVGGFQAVAGGEFSTKIWPTERAAKVAVFKFVKANAVRLGGRAWME